MLLCLRTYTGIVVVCKTSVIDPPVNIPGWGRGSQDTTLSQDYRQFMASREGRVSFPQRPLYAALALANGLTHAHMLTGRDRKKKVMRLGYEGEPEGVREASKHSLWRTKVGECSSEERSTTHRHKGLRLGFVQLELKLLFVVIDSIESLGPGLRYSALEF